MGIAMLDITDEELDAMETVDVRTVDINTLTDIRDIKIDTKLPVEKKLALFAKQTKWQVCYACHRCQYIRIFQFYISYVHLITPLLPEAPVFSYFFRK